jgi:hypothetical protein
MSRLRYEISLLNSTVTSSLTKLSNEILDIEVRTETLLDSVFANIDVKEYKNTTIEEIENIIGSNLRTPTAKLIKKINCMISISDDKKTLKIGSTVITRMATKDRITILTTVIKEVPEGDFVYKKDALTFDLEQNNLDLAIKLVTATL